VSEVPSAEVVEQLRHANARLRDLLAARDVEIEALRHARDVENAELRAVVGALTLRIAELERQLRVATTPERRRRRSRSRPRPGPMPRSLI